MKIKIENVCNINEANLDIEENQLNILYGNNGIGKSSIARAIYDSVSSNGNDYQRLTTFGSEKKPAVRFDKKIVDCLVFNNEYIDTYLFEDQDLLNNSYELIVKTKNFDSQLDGINKLLAKTKACCSTPKLRKLQSDFSIINSEVQFNSSGTDLKYSTKFGKGFKNGVSINNVVPKNIDEYKTLLQFKLNYLWVKWLSDGKQFCIDNKCPYCKNDLSTEKKAQIKDVIGFASSQLMKDNGHSKEIVKTISSYSDDSVEKKVESIISLDRMLNQDEVSLLQSCISLVKIEVTKIEYLASLDAISLKNLISSAELVERLLSAKVNTKALSSKDADLLNEVNDLNDSIDELSKNIDGLKKHLIELNKELSKNINKTKKYINEFFNIAGIPYNIDVIVDNSISTRTILKPVGIDIELESPKEYLSFGERNAISLILFSVEVKSKNHDLIILDDPVSSFDSNKKFALLHYLFECKESAFGGKTTLFLTHDFNPIIEFIKLNNYPNVKSNAKLLLNENGTIICKDILKSDIESSLRIELDLAKNNGLNLISRVCHLRRYYEMKGNLDDKYEILSSLLHCFDFPMRKANSGFSKMDEKSVEFSAKEITEIIELFDYQALIKQFKDNCYLASEYLKASHYEKLNIVRVYISNNKGNPKNDICWHFICDTYHIENLMLFGINDAKFDNIPNYIVSICDHIMNIDEKSDRY